ncbi:hypothetical protein AA23498_2797 [Acetobacter nitrogenifigens DSM 23921 = NBRC 105050]|nr:hypothetical protein AA23498_2797 [Acetobacter nitrogenifigens DSM 23921 = NBRC 105050]
MIFNDRLRYIDWVRPCASAHIEPMIRPAQTAVVAIFSPIQIAVLWLVRRIVKTDTQPIAPEDPILHRAFTHGALSLPGDVAPSGPPEIRQAWLDGRKAQEWDDRHWW